MKPAKTSETIDIFVGEVQLPKGESKLYFAICPIDGEHGRFKKTDNFRTPAELAKFIETNWVSGAVSSCNYHSLADAKHNLTGAKSTDRKIIKYLNEHHSS